MILNYKIKATLSNPETGENYFGPGVFALLTGVQQTGSLQSACKSMKMAYSKGWRILKAAEKELGQPLLNTKSGGSGGGFSCLTPIAEKYCKSYAKFCSEVNKAAQTAFEKYFNSEDMS